MIEQDNEGESSQKISYDGRQQRSKLLVNWLAMLNMAQTQNDYMLWIKSLRSIYFICFAYVKTDQAKEVKNSILKTEKLLRLYTKRNSLNETVIIDSLNESTEVSIKNFKDQFMQTSSSDAGFNIDEF